LKAIFGDHLCVLFFRNDSDFLLTIKNSAIFKGNLRAKIDKQAKKFFPKSLFRVIFLVKRFLNRPG